MVRTSRPLGLSFPCRSDTVPDESAVVRSGLPLSVGKGGSVSATDLFVMMLRLRVPAAST